MRERLLRAAGSVLAGFSIAWEHLTDRSTPEEQRLHQVPMSLQPCPMCGASLLEGPHFHEDEVVWSTEHAGAVLLTDRSGGDPVVISGGLL